MGSNDHTTMAKHMLNQGTGCRDMQQSYHNLEERRKGVSVQCPEVETVLSTTNVQEVCELHMRC